MICLAQCRSPLFLAAQGWSQLAQEGLIHNWNYQVPGVLPARGLNATANQSDEIWRPGLGVSGPQSHLGRRPTGWSTAMVGLGRKLPVDKASFEGTRYQAKVSTTVGTKGTLTPRSAFKSCHLDHHPIPRAKSEPLLPDSRHAPPHAYAMGVVTCSMCVSQTGQEA